MEIYTIGFTKKSAREFFAALRDAQIRTLIDVRLNNRSQLAGFTKQADLEYFLAEICLARYVHEPLLAPTDEILKAYRSKEISWDDYAQKYSELLVSRNVGDQLDRSNFSSRAVLLCSEPEADQCHRRLAAEHLRDSWGGLELIHL